MDFTTIAPSIPQDINQIISSASSYFPEEVRQVIRHASSYVPNQLDLLSTALFLLYFTAASLIVGFLGRVILGKRSSLNHALSSVVAILFIYAVTIVVYTFRPWNLEDFLSPLPFVTFSEDYLIILPILDMDFLPLCSQILSLVILAFLVNAIDTFLPKGNSFLGWYVLRFLSVILSMGLHLLVTWAFRTYLPGFLVTYAPTVLLILLAIMLLSGVLSLVLGLVIFIANPFLGAMYSFFFSNIIGKQISKAVFTSAILCVIAYLLEYFGYTIISIGAAALMAYIPLVIVLLVLWYLIGHTL